MAAITNTYQTYTSIGQREDLTDVIYDISPTDTPFMSNGGRGSMSATLHEWQTDSLGAVDTANKQIEGDDITSWPATAVTTRVGNYSQISRKLVLVAGTLDAVNKAGRATELAYQLAKRSKELKRDMEAIVLENIGGSAGTSGAARQMATLGAWLKTNTSFGATGGDPTYTSGVPAAARTDGTQRNITEALFKNVLQQVWASGGNLRFAMFGPVNKQNASSQFSGIATQTYNQSAAVATKIIGAADVYVSDFGTISLVANRFQRERDVWVLDPEYYSINFLRAFRQYELAKTGDAEKRMMLVEWTLKVTNEAALGGLFDMNTTVL